MAVGQTWREKWRQRRGFYIGAGVPIFVLTVCGLYGFTPLWALLPAWVWLGTYVAALVKQAHDENPYRVGLILLVFPSGAFLDTSFPRRALLWMSTLTTSSFHSLMLAPSTWALCAIYFACVCMAYSMRDAKKEQDERSRAAAAEFWGRKN